jgi:hypothetical protein
MAFSIVISSALPSTTEADVRTTFEELELGQLSKIDIVAATSRGKECLKIFIHYSSATSSGVRLRAKLAENQERQKQGEQDVQPVKIVYGTTRDGRDRYWYIYATQTPEERMETLTKKTNFKVRIDM